MARTAAWLVLIAIGAGGGAGHPVALAGVALAGAVAFAAFIGTVVSIWRGPPVVEFVPEEAARCGEEESEPVRAYAQLRGTIGGAGHVHPGRLALPAVSWAAALVAGVRGVSPMLQEAAPSPIALAVVAAVGAWLFPSRPYWYREVMGGGAIVSPPEAMGELAAREREEDAPGIAAVHQVGRADPVLRARRPHPERPPRYRLERRVRLDHGGRGVEVSTLNVSDGGLAVRWPGVPPAVGERLVLNLDEGSLPIGVAAVVRWRHETVGPGPTVGISLRAEESAARAWREMVAGLARSGALSA